MLKTGADLFNFPENCRVDQRIAKTLFAESGPLTPEDRKIFQKEIEEVVCSHVLDSDHVNLNPCTDEEHDYSCLAVIDVFLRKPDKAERIAELCHRAMPYPLLLVLHDHVRNRMFSMAEKRFSRDGQDKAVLELSVNTGWYAEPQLTDFRRAADYSLFRKNSFRDLYKYYFELLEALNCSVFTGKLQTEDVDPAARREILETLHKLDFDIAAIRTQSKKESELARLVELNMQAKRLEQQRGRGVKRLNHE